MTSPASFPLQRDASATRRLAFAATLVLAATLPLATTVAVAQYKVVGPDGKVTYTDREPTSADKRAAPTGARTPTPPPDANLPFELRQASTKYPVTLYTTNGACDPCGQAREFLKQRGIPFSERQAISNDDIDALEKISGGREAPTLTIGAQVLRGFASDSWGQYLDAAGYPRESRLPSAYQYRAATPLIDRREPAAARSAEGDAAAARPQAARPQAATPPPAPAGTGGIRF